MQNDKSKVKNDLKARTYVYAQSIIGFINTLDQKDYSVQMIVKQLLRSATSIGANIIEAQAGSSKRDFTNYFNHALKSANETKFWLGLLKDSGKAKVDDVDRLLEEIKEIANILGSSVLTLRGKNKP